MATIQKRHTSPKRQDGTFGLLANGSSGSWTIDIDEALSGAERWWARIEGPSISLRFEIPSLDVVGKIARFLGKYSVTAKRPSNGSPKRSGALFLGGNKLIPVSLVKDDEYDDRFFLVLGPTDGLTVRFAFAGTEVSELAEALRQVKEDLDDV